MLGAVVAVHVVLLMSWRIVREPPRRAAVDAQRSAPITVRFLPADADDAPRAAAPRVAAASRRVAKTAPPVASPRSATPTTTVVNSPGPAAPVAAATAPAAPPPLNLDLPQAFRRSASSPDRRIDFTASNLARTTPESRMAARLDTRVIEEQLADGVRRIRQGDRCILVHPSRAGGLDPFDHTHNQEGGVEPCPR